MDTSVLIGILAIDRDYRNIPRLLASLPRCDIVVCMRETDKRSFEEFSKAPRTTIYKVSHYDIEARHNYEAIAAKRRIVFKHALENGYDYLLSVDCDMELPRGILPNMKDLAKDNQTIVAGLYPVVWANGAALGLTMDLKLKKFEEFVEGDKLFIGGLGCTLIPKLALKVEITIGEIEMAGHKFTGEDFGWFDNVRKAGLTVVPYLKEKIKHNYVV